MTGRISIIKIAAGLICLALATAVCCMAEPGLTRAQPPSGSYEFDNLSVAEALRTIARDTGLSIRAPFDKLRETVRKSYDNVSFEEIIEDLMTRHDHAIIWHYREQVLVAVDIRIEDGSGGRSVSDQVSDDEGLSKIKPAGRVRPGRVRQGRPLTGNRSHSPPVLPPAGRHGLEPPPMPPGNNY